MRKILLINLILIFLGSCKKNSSAVKSQAAIPFNAVQIDTLFQDKISIRAVLVDKNKIWYAADNGRFVFFDFKKNKKEGYQLSNDSLKPEFRSIAKTSGDIYMLSVSNPALLYHVSKKRVVSKVSPSGKA